MALRSIWPELSIARDQTRYEPRGRRHALGQRPRVLPRAFRYCVRRHERREPKRPFAPQEPALRADLAADRDAHLRDRAAAAAGGAAQTQAPGGQPARAARDRRLGRPAARGLDWFAARDRRRVGRERAAAAVVAGDRQVGRQVLDLEHVQAAHRVDRVDDVLLVAGPDARRSSGAAGPSRRPTPRCRRRVKKPSCLRSRGVADVDEPQALLVEALGDHAALVVVEPVRRAEARRPACSAPPPLSFGGLMMSSGFIEPLFGSSFGFAARYAPPSRLGTSHVWNVPARSHAISSPSLT